YQYQIMKIDVKTNFISSNLVQKDIENLEKDLRKKLKENSLKLVMAGDVLNGIKVNNYLIKENYQSLYITLVLILIIFFIVYKSTWIAFLSLVPNVIPVVI